MKQGKADFFGSCKKSYMYCYGLISQIAKEYSKISKEHGKNYDDKEPAETFDLTLQFSLLQIALKNDTIDLDVMSFIKAITSQGDLVSVINAQSGTNLTWQQLFLSSESKQFWKEFVSMNYNYFRTQSEEISILISEFDKCNEPDYVSAFEKNIYLIFAGFSYIAELKNCPDFIALNPKDQTVANQQNFPECIMTDVIRRMKNEQKMSRKAKGLCPYCGSPFEGILVKKCSCCGRRKDY